MASVEEVPRDGGIAIRCGDTQIAIFHFASRGAWYATQNLCPHKREMVLARGIVGDDRGIPKVACPLHKNTYDLESGACLSGDVPPIATYPVRVDRGRVFVQLTPSIEGRQPTPCAGTDSCVVEAVAV